MTEKIQLVLLQKTWFYVLALYRPPECGPWSLHPPSVEPLRLDQPSTVVKYNLIQHHAGAFQFKEQVHPHFAFEYCFSVKYRSFQLKWYLAHNSVISNWNWFFQLLETRFLLGRVENIFFRYSWKIWYPTRELSLKMKNGYFLPRGIHTTLGIAKYDEPKFGMPNAKFGTFLAFSNNCR